jgi:hypothetical protein
LFMQYEQASAECDAPREAWKASPAHGIHFEGADVEGRLLGRRVAALFWDKAQAFISGADVHESQRPRN